MSSPETPSPHPAKSRVIIGEKANRSAKPKAKAKPTTVHAPYGEIDTSSPLMAKAPKSRGPSQSSSNGLGAALFIKLFRLGVKFILVTGVLFAAAYGYHYFFGSIPIGDSVKKQLGFQVAPRVQTESQAKQIVAQTKSAIAASDSRGHLEDGNAEVIEAIESGQHQALTTTPVAARPTVSVPTNRPSAPAGPSVTDKLGDMLTSLKEEATSSGPAEPEAPIAPGETISRLITIDNTDDDDTANAPPARQITIVQSSRMAVRSPFHDVNYRTGPSPSSDFTQWVQSITINRVEPEFKPKVSINNMVFISGSIVDFALGVTLAGTADDGKLVVFRDNTGAHVTVQH